MTLRRVQLIYPYTQACLAAMLHTFYELDGALTFFQSLWNFASILLGVL